MGLDARIVLVNQFISQNLPPNMLNDHAQHDNDCVYWAIKCQLVLKTSFL